MSKIPILRLACLIIGFSLCTHLCFSQDIYGSHRGDWLRKAEGYKPKLIVTEVEPKGIVEIVEDGSVYQHLKAVPVSGMDEFYNSTLQAASGAIIDFGDHTVGHLTLSLKPTKAADGPIRIKLTMGEMPAEVYVPFDQTNQPGRLELSKAWYQEEILTIDHMPGIIRLPRRYSFRYMKIELLASSPRFDVVMDKITCDALSSVSDDKYQSDQKLETEFEAIERISVKTLKDCMQTVFEDGPKRDRRIWIGDLKLQALANYYSFQNTELVKRGLYLFAATSNESGLVYGTLFEAPFVHPEPQHPIDYCLLYNTILLDYYQATKDVETIRDLWPVAKQQVLQVLPHIDENGLFMVPDEWWYFIDWNEQLDKETALHGIVIHAFQKTLELAEILNRDAELPTLPGMIKQMKKAALKYKFDKKSRLFVSGAEKQISIASQVWMILSETVSVKDGKQLLKTLYENPQAVKPVSPYMYHYLIEAMIKCGMVAEAKELIQSYWGGMVERGADTFWEVYDPDDDFLSPYNSYLINSYCHAWSCTPVYFIRKYQHILFK